MVGGSARQISLKTQRLLMLMQSPSLCCGTKTADSPNPVSRLNELSLDKAHRTFDPRINLTPVCTGVELFLGSKVLCALV